jgi:methionyl-tRNA synthetase
MLLFLRHSSSSVNVVDGEKISKSLGNVIDPVELVEQVSSNDLVRYSKVAKRLQDL